MAQSGPGDSSIVRLLTTETYFTQATLCLGAYEYVISFDREVQLVWQKRFNATSMLLFAFRVVMIVGPIINCLPLGPSLSLCKMQNTLSMTVLFVSTALIASFSALRVYALLQRSRAKWILSGMVFVIRVIPIAVNIVDIMNFFYAVTIIAPDVLVCSSFSTLSASSGTRRVTISSRTRLRSDLFTRTDAVVLVVTWATCYQQFFATRGLQSISSLTKPLLRDGTAYFLTMLVIEILLLLMYVNKTFSKGEIVQGIVTYMPIVLIQRFLLNLRHLNHTHEDASAVFAQQPSRFTLSFRAPSDFLGNIGEPLDHGQSDHELFEGGGDDQEEERGSESEGGGAHTIHLAPVAAGPSQHGGDLEISGAEQATFPCEGESLRGCLV
ncbi:hypothetical protein PsYK624_169340 [Phanerochaete sordida]|uniref:DUF6533 domain-containing protein n=1 Tax=Phanerochaete sordida TaxID=48140 RepID=A0A9P3GY84_9APHY|nr:hypothetical protein PsYK624_169340 [Phanerochaete sordida]